MRPEHSETKTETRNYETETSLVNSVAYERKTNLYAFIINLSITYLK